LKWNIYRLGGQNGTLLEWINEYYSSPDSETRLFLLKRKCQASI